MTRTLCIALIVSTIGTLSVATDASAHRYRCHHHCHSLHFWRPGYYGHGRGR